MEAAAAVTRARASVLLAGLIGAVSPGLGGEARADERGIVLAGAQGSGATGYGYAGWLAPWPGYRLGAGPVYRLWIDYLRYEYPLGPTTIEAKGPGAEAALGYLGTRGDLAWGVYAGAVYRDTSLSPDDPDNRAGGGRLGARLQGELGQPLGAGWRWSGIASYETTGSGYWARARLLRNVDGPVAVGPELVVQGSPDYDAQQAGIAVVGLPLGADAGAGFAIGAQRSATDTVRLYIGVEFAFRM